MNKRNFYITVFIISILGLAIVQYRYLEIGLNLAKYQFNRKIGTASEIIKKDLATKNQLTFLIGQAFEKDTSFFTMSLDSIEDASSHFLNDFLIERLVFNGIDANFTYELHTRDTSYYLSSPTRLKKGENIIYYPIELSGYLPDLIGQRLILELHFKNLDANFLSKLNGLVFPGLLFLLGIIATLIWVLRTYYWQRSIISTTSEFIDNLTHELKTPVFSIGLATKLLEKEASENQKKVVAIIRQQVQRLTTHIDKVLELGSLEAKTKVFHLEKVDFRIILLKICTEFEFLVALENTPFAYELENRPYPILAEVFHLENAVNNLLDNAKKYARHANIILSAKIQHQNLNITISDNGKGISKDDQKRIFQKYYRVSSGDVHEVKGYGLGLAYVKKVMDKHNGKVTVESALGKGTTIILIIPINNG